MGTKSYAVHLAVLLTALLPAVGNAQTQVVEILHETFEGSFPTGNGWSLQNTDGWGVTSYRALSGSYSGYCGIAAGVTPPGPYVSDMNTWMVYGPFDLSDASSGKITFNSWIETEADYDYLKFMVSLDGTNYHGYQASGNAGDVWTNRVLDFTAVPTLGDICGNSQVWFAIIFQSDGSMQHEGAYVDNIRIVKTLTNSLDDAYEPNDTFITAWDFSSGESVWLSSWGGEEGVQVNDDWYQIHVPSGAESVRAECLFLDADGDIDIGLYDSYGNVFVPVSGNRQSTSTTDNEVIDCVVPSAGTYYLRVYYGNGGNRYDLYWEATEPPVTTPVVSLTEPASNRYIYAGEPVHLAWSGMNGDEVVLYYDLDTTWGNGNETVIASGMPQNGTFDWVERRLAAGVYHLVAYNSDASDAFYAYAPGEVHVMEPTDDMAVFTDVRGVSEQRVRLEWATPETAGGVLIVRATSSSATFTPVNGSTYSPGPIDSDWTCVFFGSGSAWLDGGLTVSTQYRYLVFAYDAYHSYADGMEARVWTTESMPPELRWVDASQSVDIEDSEDSPRLVLRFSEPMSTSTGNYISISPDAYGTYEWQDHNMTLVLHLYEGLEEGADYWLAISPATDEYGNSATLEHGFIATPLPHGYFGDGGCGVSRVAPTGRQALGLLLPWMVLFTIALVLRARRPAVR